MRTDFPHWVTGSCSLQAFATGFAFAIATALAVGALQVDLVLFADGAYFYIKQLQQEGFHLFSPARLHAEYFVQVPMQSALRLGVTNTDLLLKLHGLGAYGLPLGAIVFCGLYSRDPLFTLMVLLSFALSHLPVWSMGISEAHFAAALFWVSAALIRNNRGLTPAELAGLILLGLLMIRSYESNLVFAPLLIATLFLSRKNLRTPVQRGAALCLVLVLLFGTGFALSETLWARDSGNKDQFLQSIPRVARDYLMLPLVPGAAVILALVQRRLPQRLPLALSTAVMLLVFGAAYMLIRRSDFYLGEIIYSSRVLLMLVPAGLYTLYLAISEYGPQLRAGATRVTAVLVLLSFAAQAAIQFETMRQWAGYHRIFDATMAAPGFSGMTDVRDTPLVLQSQDGIALYPHRWPGWTLPILSVAWAPDRVVRGAVYERQAGFVPYGGFLPRMPDRYGYQYHPFVPGQSPSHRDAAFRFEGWSRPAEADKIWSRGFNSRVYFDVENPQDMIGKIYLDVGSFGAQQVFARLNGKRIGKFTLDNSAVYGFIDFDTKRLLTGENELAFRFENPRPPGPGDRRKLAMYLRHIAIR
jgi:hypothetical protein